MDVKKMTKGELEKLRSRIENQLEKLSTDDLRKAKAAAEKVAKKFGYTLADLGGGGAPKSAKRKGKAGTPKFKDPDTGRTWTGKGRQPEWFKSAIAAGKKPEDLAI